MRTYEHRRLRLSGLKNLHVKHHAICASNLALKERKIPSLTKIGHWLMFLRILFQSFIFINPLNLYNL